MLADLRAKKRIEVSVGSLVRTLAKDADDRQDYLRVGMALAVEPMLTAGDPETRELDDGWTVCTSDGLPSAHFEHTIAKFKDGDVESSAAQVEHHGFELAVRLV